MKLVFLIFLIFILICSLQADSKWLGKDKALHFTGSAFITYWNYGVSKDIMNNTKDESIYFAVSFTALLGAGKEFGDKKTKRTNWGWQDITYNIVGIAFGIFLINNMR
jgi:putative lipoprotein